MPIPIHNHSEYSALDGLSTVKEIADRCEELCCPACGLSDHGTIAGHLSFAKELDKRDIKPIFACECYHGVKTEFDRNERDQAHFVIGALNNSGLRNLWRLVDKSASNFRYVGRVNWDMLKDNSDGLFATSACMAGLVSNGLKQDNYDDLNRYLDIYKDNFYIELHTYNSEEQKAINLGLVDLARAKGVPILYADDAHFASPDQYEYHDSYIAIQTGDSVYTPDEERKMKHPSGSLYIKSEEEIYESLDYLPKDVVQEAIDNSHLLADRVNAQLPEIKRHLPQFISDGCPWIPEGLENADADELFMHLAEKGIEECYEEPDEKIWERASKELEVLIDAGMEHYFLQAWDLCQHAKENNLKRGPARGSSGGSIIAYALGITDIDPLKFDLLFERFYNAGREKGFPDIDIDFSKEDRKKIRQYLIDRWGEKRVLQIGNIVRMKPKGVCDKSYNAFGIEYRENNELKQILDTVPDYEALGADSIGWDEDIDPGKTIYVMDEVGEEIINWISNKTEERQEAIAKWLEFVRIACSRVSSYSVHASGIVVSDVDLEDELPSRWSADQKIHVTIFPMDDIDERQFLKDDILGLQTLDVLHKWQELTGKEIDWRELIDYSENEAPEELWELFDNGHTLGVFQIERNLPRQWCKELGFKPRSIEDLGIISSLNRPGPIRSGAPEKYILRSMGKEEVTYDHPILEPILKKTYGLFLYQEQIINFFSAIGYTLQEADSVRKILGKKLPEKMKELHDGTGDWKDRGYTEMAVKAGIDKPTAKKIWDILDGFSKYSFNKSHADGYGVISFGTAYAKYHGLAEYIISCIDVFPKRAGAFVGEGRTMGIKVLPPNIMESGIGIESVDDHIYFGFSNIKGIGKMTAKFITELRDKYDIRSPELLDEALQQEQKIWQQLDDDKRKKIKSPRTKLKSNQIPMIYDTGAWDDFEDRDISLAQKQKKEKELLDVVLSDNSDDILNAHVDEFEECDSYSELYVSDQEKFIIPGVIRNIKDLKTKKDKKPMGVISIEYDGDEASCVVFPNTWKSYKFMMKEGTVGIFELNKKDSDFSLKSAIKLAE